MNYDPSRGFQTEIGAESFFDEFIEKSGLFFQYKQVKGRVSFSARGIGNTVIIDRILSPKFAAINSGFVDFGLFGVELKKKDESLSKTVSQAIDYRNSLFKLEGTGALIVPSFVFIFPYRESACGIGGFMSQNDIGFAYPDGKEIKFRLASQVLFSISEYGLEITEHFYSFGKKTGNRS